MGLMAVLWLLGVLVRVLSLSAWPDAGMPLFGLEGDTGDGQAWAEGIARLHTDNHVSLYTFVIFIAQALGAKATLLRASSLGCDAVQALVWLVWLGRRNVRAARIYLALWAASPLFVHVATSPGPHAALGLWTTLGFVSLWPVWQQQRPSAGAQVWLAVVWGVLVAAHPLGMLAVGAMVLVGLAWPKASAQALSNSLNTSLGQAGRLAQNIGQPALVAGIVYVAMRLLGHVYPSPQSSAGAAPLDALGVARALSAAWGTDHALFVSSWQVAWPMPLASGVVLTTVGIFAGASHSTGQKLVSIAVLYGVGLAAYHSVVPVFSGPTLTPAWVLLLAGGALGLGQAKSQTLVRLCVVAMALWQLNLWLRACPLFALPF